MTTRAQTTPGASTKTIKRKVAGRTFHIDVPAEHDAEYGLTVSTVDLARAELEIAAQLALEGPVSGETFRFVRSALGLQAKDLAALLDVSAETVSRWENGARDVDRGAWLTLGTIALERAGHTAHVEDRLQRLAAGMPASKEVRVDVRAAAHEAALESALAALVEAGRMEQVVAALRRALGLAAPRVGTDKV